MTIRPMRQDGETNGAGKPGREAGRTPSDLEAPLVLRRTQSPAEAPASVDPWERLRHAALDPRHLARHRLISAGREDPAYVAFDVLRTRLLQSLKARGWSRVAITSPTKGCGKTFVAANLAFSLARTSSRVALMDMDLRIPSLASVLGVREPGTMLDFLTGARPMERHLLRVAPNLAVGLNAAPVSDASELLQASGTAETLAAMQGALRPDVVIYDLPPALLCDDLTAFLPQVDGVLLVAGGGVTQAEEIRKCERLLAEQTPLLGVILNKAEDAAPEPYGYVGR